MRLPSIAYTLYVDLDGVMADLDKFVTKLTGQHLSNDDVKDAAIWDVLNARKEDGLPTFSVLDKLPDADVLWNYIEKYEPNILTATGRDYEYGKREKTKWVERNLSGYDEIIVVQRSRDKAAYAAPRHILIDDRMQSIGPWRRAGGIGILHKSAEETCNLLKTLGL